MSISSSTIALRQSQFIPLISYHMKINKAQNKMKKFTEPYVHYAIENFLPEEKLGKLKEVYDHLQFLEKQSDLFNFFQTNELAKQPSLEFFRQELSHQFQELTPMKDTTYSIFASYYFKGNHLLCHDDVVQDRMYAFSYYLEDFGSGELVFYDDTASKIQKKIKVKKNLLVIFEVALAKQDGRKAVTGWLNKKGWGRTRPVKIMPPFKPSMPKDPISFDFPHDISTEEYLTFPGVQYEFNYNSFQQNGPFYERKAWKMSNTEEQVQQVVMKLKGFQLFSAQFWQFNKGDYMLLNDPVNNLGSNVLDVFILKMASQVEGDFITIVGDDGEVQGNIPYASDTMFMVHRGTKKYYIDLVQKEIKFAHFIYKKVGKSSKGKRTIKEKSEKQEEVPEKVETKVSKNKVAAQKALQRKQERRKQGSKKTVASKKKHIRRVDPLKVKAARGLSKSKQKK